MLFRFLGQYTGGRSSVNACGVVFHGREPADVTEPDGIRRLSGHPEFELVPVAEDRAEVPEPKRRGRPRKVTNG